MDTEPSTSAAPGDVLVEGDMSELAVAVQAPSPTPSASSWSLGFTTRKVELRDGFLVVSESDADSACTSIMGDRIEEWENVYLKHSTEIVDKETGFITTPLHCVKKLAEILKKEVHIEHFILKDPKRKGKKIYRVDIMCGELRGSGQCVRKQLARQLAAIDVYEKIQLQQIVLERPTPMPRCGLLPGWRIDKMVYPTLLKQATHLKNLGNPLFTILPPPDNKPGKFTAVCKVGNSETRGENDYPWLAKRLAAKEMYEIVTGDEFRLRQTPMGNEVLGFPQMRLLGFNPQITNLKRDWMMQYRITDTQIDIPSNEPDDGDMDEVEEEFQIQQSRRFKIADHFAENLKVTVRGQSRQNVVANFKVTIKGEPKNVKPSLKVTFKKKSQAKSREVTTTPFATTSARSPLVNAAALAQERLLLEGDDDFDGDNLGDNLVLYADEDALLYEDHQ